MSSWVLKLWMCAVWIVVFYFTSFRSHSKLKHHWAMRLMGKLLVCSLRCYWMNGEWGNVSGQLKSKFNVCPTISSYILSDLIEWFFPIWFSWLVCNMIKWDCTTMSLRWKCHVGNNCEMKNGNKSEINEYYIDFCVCLHSLYYMETCAGCLGYDVFCNQMFLCQCFTVSVN